MDSINFLNFTPTDFNVVTHDASTYLKHIPRDIKDLIYPKVFATQLDLITYSSSLPLTERVTCISQNHGLLPLSQYRDTQVKLHELQKTLDEKEEWIDEALALGTIRLENTKKLFDLFLKSIDFNKIIEKSSQETAMDYFLLNKNSTVIRSSKENNLILFLKINIEEYKYSYLNITFSNNNIIIQCPPLNRTEVVLHHISVNIHLYVGLIKLINGSFFKNLETDEINSMSRLTGYKITK